MKTNFSQPQYYVKIKSISRDGKWEGKLKKKKTVPDHESKAAKWNSTIINFIIQTHVFHTVTCQNVLLEKGHDFLLMCWKDE